MVLSIPLNAIFKKFSKNIFSIPIDNSIHRMVVSAQMNEVQIKIAQLESNGWTLAAIATELGHTPNAVEKWKAGDRSPRNYKAVSTLLEELIKRRRVPKKRRYTKGSRPNTNIGQS